EVGVAATATADGTDLTWVLYNGYQSWDPSGHIAATGGTRESWWTICLADDAGRGIAAAATCAESSCTQFTVADGVLSITWREADMLEPRPSLFAGTEGSRWQADPLLISVGP